MLSEVMNDSQLAELAKKARGLVDASPDASYGRAVHVMEVLKSAGLLTFGISMAPPELRSPVVVTDNPSRQLKAGKRRVDCGP
jgi:hypothetical protein